MLVGDQAHHNAVTAQVRDDNLRCQALNEEHKPMIGMSLPASCAADVQKDGQANADWCATEFVTARLVEDGRDSQGGCGGTTTCSQELRGQCQVSTSGECRKMHMPPAPCWPGGLETAAEGADEEGSRVGIDEPAGPRAPEPAQPAMADYADPAHPDAEAHFAQAKVQGSVPSYLERHLGNGSTGKGKGKKANGRKRKRTGSDQDQMSIKSFFTVKAGSVC